MQRPVTAAYWNACISISLTLCSLQIHGSAAAAASRHKRGITERRLLDAAGTTDASAADATAAADGADSGQQLQSRQSAQRWYGRRTDPTAAARRVGRRQ